MEHFLFHYTSATIPWRTSSLLFQEHPVQKALLEYLILPWNRLRQVWLCYFSVIIESVFHRRRVCIFFFLIEHVTQPVRIICLSSGRTHVSFRSDGLIYHPLINSDPRHVYRFTDCTDTTYVREGVKKIETSGSLGRSANSISQRGNTVQFYVSLRHRVNCRDSQKS